MTSNLSESRKPPKIHGLAFPSPLGPLTLEGREGVERLSFLDRIPGDAPLATASEELLRAREQILAYLQGRRRNFSLNLKISGTAFQKAVYKVLQELAGQNPPQTLTYAELALRIGRPKSARSVGSALAKNPLPIILPCHRILPKSKGLGGYLGSNTQKSGLEIKAWLLKLDGLDAQVHHAKNTDRNKPLKQPSTPA